MKKYIALALIALAMPSISFAQDPATGEKPAVLVKKLPEPASLQAALTELKAYEFGKSRLALIYTENQVLAAVGTDKAKDMENALLPLLPEDAATPDARRFVIRLIGMVGAERTADALGPLLQDPQYSGHALQALEGMGGRLAGYVDAVLVREAQAGSPELRATIVSALARRDSTMLPSTAKHMFDDADAHVRNELAMALSSLGTPEACNVLGTDFFKEGADRSPLYPGCAPCAEVLAKDAASAENGLAWLRALLTPETPAFVRAQAYIAAARLAPYEDENFETARKELTALVDGDNDIEMMRARVKVLEVNPEGGAELAALAGSEDTAIRLIAIESLARRKDPAGAAVGAANLGSEDPDLRAAAYRALIASASDDAIDPLFAQAAGEDSKAARDAMDALSKLDAPGANARLAELAGGADAAQQAIAIELLGMRRAFDQRGAAMAALSSANADVASAAHTALRIIAQEEELPALLDGAMATDSDSAKDYQTTAVTLAARLPVEQRIALLKERLDAAQDPAARAVLVSLIGRVGGDAAFAVLEAAATDADPGVQLAAAKGLATWPDTAALVPLEKILNAGAESEAGQAAFDGMVRHLTDGDVPSPEAVNYVQILRKSATSDSDRRRLLQAINTVTDMRAFRIAENFAKEPALQAEAEQSLVNLGARLAGAYTTPVQARMAQIARSTERENLKTAAQAVVGTINRSRDYITSWSVSGPYRIEGKRANDIYDVHFAPEDGLRCGDAVSTGHLGWEIAPLSPAADKPGYVDLEAEFRANECVAYVRTCFTVASATVGKLSIGSDDGCKVWHNGDLRLESLGMRHYVEGEDSILLQLDQGEHTIVIAVYQHASTWGFSAKLTSPDGGRLSTISFNEPN